MLQSEIAMLSDELLQSIGNMKGLPKPYRTDVLQELRKRGLSASSVIHESKNQISKIIKAILVFIPGFWFLIILLQLILNANWIVSPMQWKQYWFFLRVGFINWFILTLIIAKVYF